jgi:hypothetical protein
MPSPIHPALYWLSIAATVAMLGWWVSLYLRAVRAQPHFEQRDVVFQEWFASGCSQKSIITRIGGARNCLRLVITKEFLWVTSWFPFSLLAPFYDMEHVIPLNRITSVKRDLFFGRVTFLVAFTTENGASRVLRLAPKQPDAFVQSLGVALDHETPAQLQSGMDRANPRMDQVQEG